MILHSCPFCPDVNKTFLPICFSLPKPASYCFGGQYIHQMWENPAMAQHWRNEPNWKVINNDLGATATPCVVGGVLSCQGGCWLCVWQTPHFSHTLSWPALRYLPTPPVPPSVHRYNQLAGVQPVCIPLFLRLLFLFCNAFASRWDGNQTIVIQGHTHLICMQLSYGMS